MTRMFTLKKLLFYIMVSLALQISLVGQVTNSIETQIKNGFDRKSIFNLDEIKVRWKKAALENCPGVPCPSLYPPGPCSSIIATPTGPSSASVSFVPPTYDGGSPITGYVVTATSTPSAPAKRKSSAIITATGTAPPIIVTGLTFGVNYIFTVLATNAVGPSPTIATTSTVTPCVLNTATAASTNPTLVVNTVLTPSITIATTGATNIGTATGLPSGVTASWLAGTITISGTPTVTGTFNYTIPLTGGCGIVNATGTITVNAATSAILTTTAVSSITATGASSGGTISSDGGGPITSKGVVWSTSTAPTVSLSTKTTDGTGTGTFTSTISGLAASTTYYVRAYATNAAGTSYGTELTFSTPVAPTVPGAPTSVTAVGGNAQAIVSFTAPSSTGGSAITGYTVTSSPTGGIGTGTGTPITVTGLANGTSYTFSVVATNAVGSSSPSVSSAVIPDAPTNVTAVAGNAQTIVSFTAPSSTGGSAITGYTVTSSPTGGTGTGTGTPITVTGLTNGTAYTFTVVATNVVGNSVASAASTAVTPVACPTSTVTDIDGNVYSTVAIGTQCWTKENLKVTRYNNNDIIPDSTNSTMGTAAIGALTDYVGQSGYVGTYGYLYNWYAATDLRKICPSDWHVPTDTDWTNLTNFLGPNSPGNKLKENNSTLWSTNNIGTDDFGFSGRPGGYRIGIYFYSVRNLGIFWSATQIDGLKAWLRVLSNNGNLENGTGSPGGPKSMGASVRCLKD
jgi:uncharacterized protein (TIGR02145 family)